MIITMDGLSGAGKSCQAESLSKRRGYEVVNFYEKKVAHNIELSSLSNPCYHLIWLEEVSTAPLDFRRSAVLFKCVFCSF